MSISRFQIQLRYQKVIYKKNSASDIGFSYHTHEGWRVIGNGTKIEDRKFSAYNRYWPIPQDALDRNPQLKQNPGY